MFELVTLKVCSEVGENVVPKYRVCARFGGSVGSLSGHFKI